MRTLSVRLKGQELPVHVLESQDDLYPFCDWLERPRRALAVDTETTGLDTYSVGFRVRLVQVGDLAGSWVIPVDCGESWARSAVEMALAGSAPLVFHNATFDILALDAVGLGRLEWLYPRALDTKVLSHLLDPRATSEGGVGHSLKGLSAHWVDAEAPDSQKALADVFRALKLTQDTGWANIPLDQADYLRYAGADTILTAHLLEALGPEVKARGLSTLASFEMDLAHLLARVERRGLLVDGPYLEGLALTLAHTREVEEAHAARWGVTNVESTAQVAEALEALGAPLPERTPTGNAKVDKAVLEALAGEYELARHVLAAKQAQKFRTAFVDSMLGLRDSRGRVHPKINALQARTARMSVSRPPFQQLPSKDATIRDGVLADPGQVIISADFAQVELRILAALAREEPMLAAIASGVDLHDMTATAIWGPGFTKAQRGLAKTVAFGKVYGGGAATISRQAGVTLEQAREAAGAYDARFPGIKRYGRRLQDGAEWGRREVVTPSGRHLPLDRDRLYAATNYVVQSTARDVFAQALLDLDAAGLGDHILLPVHDEVIAQAPTADAAEVAKAIGETMSMDFQGVHLLAEGEVFGPRWGDGYR